MTDLRAPASDPGSTAPRGGRVATWLERWRPILPLLIAEFVVWLGFGGLLPVLPLYLTEHGIDLATLGLIVAAWPAARLLSEPIFGWIADRTARVPLMVIGLVATGIFGALPLVLTGPLAFIAAARRLRAGRGDLRPGGARVPDRCDAARAPRRGVRAVRRSPDGRPAAGSVDRGPRGIDARRHRLRLRVQRGHRRHRRGRDRAARRRGFGRAADACAADGRTRPNSPRTRRTSRAVAPATSRAKRPDRVRGARCASSTAA